MDTNNDIISEEEQRKIDEIMEQKTKEPKLKKPGAKFDSATYELNKQKKENYKWLNPIHIS